MPIKSLEGLEKCNLVWEIRSNFQTMSTCQPRELLPLKWKLHHWNNWDEDDTAAMVVFQTSGSQHYHKCLPTHKTGAWILENDNNFYNQEAGKEKLEHWWKKISYLHDPAYQQKIVKRVRRCLYSYLGFQTLTWMALLGGIQLASRTLATKEYWKRNF